MSSDDDSTGAMGGMLLVVVVLVLVGKMLGGLADWARVVFYKIDLAAQSFFEMAYHGGIILGIVAIAGAVVFASGYCCYRYFQVVNKGTMIIDIHNEAIDKFKEELESNKTDLTARINNKTSYLEGRIRYLNEKLDEALAPSEVAPETQDEKNKDTEVKEEIKDTAEENKIVTVDVQSTSLNPY